MFDRRGGLVSAEWFVLIWGAGLLALLSFGVFSLDPLRFFMKQQNYMLIFLAPLALLGGFALSRIAARWAALVMAGMAAGALLITSAAQLTERTTSANLEPAARYLREHPDALIYGSYRFAAAAPIVSLFEFGRWDDRIKPFTAMPKALRPDAPDPCVAAAGAPAYVIVDPATLYLGWRSEFVRFDTIPSCWRMVAKLEGRDFGLGSRLVLWVQELLAALPEPAARSGLRLLDWFVKLPPKSQPTTVYEIPGAAPRR
jgi:hypothetical protein